MAKDFDIDLSSVEQAQEIVAQKEANEIAESDDEEEESTGNKVIFWIFMGVISVLGIGVPILIYVLIKKINQNKQLQKQLDEKATTEEKPAENAEAEKSETKSEEKAEEKKEEKPSEKK